MDNFALIKFTQSIQQKKFILLFFTLSFLFIAPVNQLPAAWGSSRILAQNSLNKNQADELFRQGKQQSRNGNLQAALISWKRALQIYRDIKNLGGVGKTLEVIGVTYTYLGDDEKAIKYHEQSLAIAKQLNSPRAIANTLGNLGIAYSNLGNYQKSVEFYEQSLAISKR